MTVKTSTALFLTNQKVSIWVVEAPWTGGEKKEELGNDRQSVTTDFAWYMKIYLLHDGTHLHTNTYSPVNHGGVAGVHVDANTVPRSGIPSTTDSMQTLQDAEKHNPNQWTKNLYKKKSCHFLRVILTATKSTFFTVDLGMVNGSHRSCERKHQNLFVQ